MRFVNKEMVVGKGVGGRVGPEGPRKVGDSFGPVLPSSLRQLNSKYNLTGTPCTMALEKNSLFGPPCSCKKENY